MTNQNNCVNLKTVEVTQAQLSFLEFCKEYGWGRLEVTVKNGEPVMSREVVRDHKHD